MRMVQGVVSTYGGYFGGGIGILVLAALSLYGMRYIRSMNGTKAILTALMGMRATVVFAVSGRVRWTEISIMMATAMARGVRRSQDRGKFAKDLCQSICYRRWRLPYDLLFY